MLTQFSLPSREEQAALWRRQQFETPSFEGSPMNIAPNKGNNNLKSESQKVIIISIALQKLSLIGK